MVNIHPILRCFLYAGGTVQMIMQNQLNSVDGRGYHYAAAQQVIKDTSRMCNETQNEMLEDKRYKKGLLLQIMQHMNNMQNSPLPFGHFLVYEYVAVFFGQAMHKPIHIFLELVDIYRYIHHDGCSRLANITLAANGADFDSGLCFFFLG